MSNLDPSKGTVLVTNASRGSAITIIRSLGRQGWRVIAADSDQRSLGFRSKYAREQLHYPDPKHAPQAFVETLLNAACERKIDLIIPVTDEVIHPLAHARPKFEKVCRLALPETEALAAVTDKNRTMQLAQRLGVPTPQTYFVCTVREAQRAVSRLREQTDFAWPVVLKPQVSRSYRLEQDLIENWSVSYANSMAELNAQMQMFAGRCGVLLQTYCRGSGQGVELLAYEGRPLLAFQHKRLAEIPINGGASAWRESVPLDPQLYDYSARLVEALAWTGLIMVEFKGDEHPLLMEINGRVWGSLPLAVLSGVDFPARLADLYSHGPPTTDNGPVVDYKVGLRAFNLELISSWIPQVLIGKRSYPYLPIPPRRRALAAFLGILSPSQKLDILSFEDLGPGLAEIGKIGHKFSRKLMERIKKSNGQVG